MSSASVPDLSIVVPLFNEEESLPLLVEKLLLALRPLGRSFELVLVDDGSSDRTAEVLRQQAAGAPELVAVLLRRNYGQTAAMAAGFDASRGRLIVTLDGDLQNDPADIPMLLERLEQGYDLVSGWRHQRQDHAVSRLLPSKIANALIARVTGVRLHDYGCSLKAYRRELVEDMNLYGELHRFLPALAFIEGARIAEVKVNHNARQFGQSKYGIDRTFRVLMDLFTVWFMKRFLTRPMYVFGFGGLSAMAIGALLSAYLLMVKLGGAEIGNRPLLLVAVLALITGVQLFCFGLLSEVQMRTYHESQGRPIYRIRETLRGSLSG
ncbi:MAG: glycosyltransferase family 2 protein [Cyanobacteria bacterium]|uniref:glycosyltransferase family 2 protein n=1 Tax=Synechococcaceae TaxID=1890426 RepID=UPI0002001193|nr:MULTISPECIES: glycosyltransferase family 2 protein [Synechococcaceae]MDA0964200.1 glycosyltransferase family 2 protein [Cyanobacteriota bacterium]MDA1157748.1 glycosyltransferase family 2 protein [Cyanobacteriota bacterium]NCV91948.1 glycosyltransferase [Synechococcaceae bacterium WB7_3xG_012]